MLYQALHLIAGLLALVAGFKSGRALHSAKFSGLLWITLFVGVMLISPEVIEIICARLTDSVDVPHWFASRLLGYATVFGCGTCLALTLPPPGAFRGWRRSGEEPSR